jgi:hypothetical protein
MSAEIGKKIDFGSSLGEVLVVDGNRQLPFLWQNGYASTIINPDLDDVVRYAEGGPPAVNPNSKVLLLPIQENGRCAADCEGCVFANSRNLHTHDNRASRIATPVNPHIMRLMMDNAQESAEANGILDPGERYRVNVLLAGDPSFNRYTSELILLVASNPRVSASRWSTIAMDTSSHPLNSFKEAARQASYWGLLDSHKLRFQVSLHSTDEEARIKHVEYYSRANYSRLISMEDIAGSFSEIKTITGNASTLSFVVHNRSIIDPNVLANIFNTNNTWVSLRPIIPTNGSVDISMPTSEFQDLYLGIREKGFNVLIMPTLDGSEQKNLAK